MIDSLRLQLPVKEFGQIGLGAQRFRHTDQKNR